MLFSTQGVKDESSKGIGPGVYEVKIEKVEGGTSPGSRNPYIEFSFKRPDAGADVKANRFRLFFTDKIKEDTLRQIKHIMTKVTTEDQVDAIKAADAVAYGTALNALAANKVVRMKFTGEEKVYEGRRVTHPRIPRYPDFCEAVVPGAKYAPVAADATKLEYDPEKNKYDLRKLTAEEEAMLEGDDVSTSITSEAKAATDF